MHATTYIHLRASDATVAKVKETDGHHYIIASFDGDGNDLRLFVEDPDLAEWWGRQLVDAANQLRDARYGAPGEGVAV